MVDYYTNGREKATSLKEMGIDELLELIKSRSLIKGRLFASLECVQKTEMFCAVVKEVRTLRKYICNRLERSRKKPQLKNLLNILDNAYFSRGRLSVQAELVSVESRELAPDNPDLIYVIERSRLIRKEILDGFGQTA